MSSTSQSNITRTSIVGRDTSDTFTTEPATDGTPSTVFICLTKGSCNQIIADVRAIRGPSLRDDQKESFKRFKQRCYEKSLSMSKETGGKFSAFADNSIQSAVQTFQCGLDDMTPHPPGTRVIAVDGKDILESWSKLATRNQLDRACGHLVLSVKDPKAVSGATFSKGWFSSSKEAEITGCKIWNGRPSGPQRKEANKKLHDFGSRYLDLKNSNVWPGESVATELSNRPEHLGCGVVTVSEAMFSLPGMFEDVVYTRGNGHSDQGKRSDDHAPASEDLIDFEHETPANADKTATTGLPYNKGEWNEESWETW
ncbi:hypothetical protein V866_000629 [Kwoniella sp. B9012]